MSEKRIRSEREVLSRGDIEERVRRMLDYVLPDRSNDVSLPDLKEVVPVLQSRYGVHFSFCEDVGHLSTARILGISSVDPLTIRVSPVLPTWTPGFCRTLAHELGHIVLHRKMIGEGKYISREKPIVDTEAQLRYREMAELSDHGWVEWQANEFGMCLILPRRYLELLVCSVQSALGITRNLGTMYLDDQWCNKRDCERVVDEIAERSGAKKPLIWRRLRFLGILQDHRKESSRSVFEVLDALFETDGEQTHGEATSESTRCASSEGSRA